MFNAAKDAIASHTAQNFLNARISRYGKVERLKIDSERKQVEVTCQLDGEPSAVSVRVGRYVIEAEGAKRFVRIADCTCSRPWLENLLNDLSAERRFEIPAWAAAAL